MSTTDRIASRVAAAYLTGRPRAAALVGDPKRLVEEFNLAIHTLASKTDPHKLAAARVALEKAIRDKDPYANLSYEEVTGPAYRAYLQIKDLPLVDTGHALFLSILQSYTLPPKLLKQVEMASRTYLRSRAPNIPARGPEKYLGAINVYERTLAEARAHLQVAREAIAQGKAHTEEGAGATRIKAGPFVLLNTGGFSEEVMAEVSEVVQKAAAHVQRSGLGEVLYGDVHITNSIKLNPRTLAFYLLAQDEMFVRAKVKPTIDTVRTVIHELGHRYEAKFLRGGARTAERLYHSIDSQESRRKLEEPKLDKPRPGEKLVDKGVTYSVLTTDWSMRGGYKVILTPEDEGVKPGVTVSISLEGWHDKKNPRSTPARDPDAPDHLGFVTAYAKTDASENFAEMFSFYCMGKMNPALRALFEEYVFGSSRTVH